MASAKLVRRLWILGIFVLPVIAVKAAAVLLGGDAPRSAQATPAENPPVNPAVGPKTAKWTARQVAAATHIESIRKEPFGESPLLYLEEPKPVIADPNPEPIAVELPVELEPEITFVLNAVMSGSRGKTALIDGRPYREGDRIRGTDWDVKAIDCDHRLVTLHNPSRGTSKTVRVETPLPTDEGQTGTGDN